MPITIKKLHPLFVAEIGGVDTGAPMDDATFGKIRAALDEYSVLVFHDKASTTTSRSHSADASGRWR